jgi:hypothetical protein
MATRRTTLRTGDRAGNDATDLEEAAAGRGRANAEKTRFRPVRGKARGRDAQGGHKSQTGAGHAVPAAFAHLDHLSHVMRQP